MKALIIGADAVSPEYIFGKEKLFPNLNRLANEGAYGAYSAYVQKGYTDSYWSEMNWSSLYTGLEPKEHKIAVKFAEGKRIMPQMSHFNNLTPFWQVFNENGYSVGLWAADCCMYPVEINGYVVSAKYELIETPQDKREAPRELQLCEKDEHIRSYLKGKVPPRLYPKTLKQQGVTFEQLKKNKKFALKTIESYHFQDSLENFQSELDFFKNSIINTQKNYPVDVLYFYTPTTDLISHCCMYCDDNDVLIKAYKILDDFVGELQKELAPENTVFMSDHGQKNFKELVKCSDEKIAYEALFARENVIWLPNGYIAFEGRNGALLFTFHSLKGTFIVAGKDIAHKEILDMRTIDIYTTLLEILHVKVPENKQGYVTDVFKRPVLNDGKLYNKASFKIKQIAIIQTHVVSLTDIFINEIYIENRFAKLTVVGEKKYEEIFKNNPRVANFVDYDTYSFQDYDEVFCGIYNETTGCMSHIKVTER